MLVGLVVSGEFKVREDGLEVVHGLKQDEHLKQLPDVVDINIFVETSIDEALDV